MSPERAADCCPAAWGRAHSHQWRNAFFRSGGDTCEAKRKAGKVTSHPHTSTETVIRLFKKHTNDAPLAAIDKLTATDFLEQIGKLDPPIGTTWRARVAFE